MRGIITDYKELGKYIKLNPGSICSRLFLLITLCIFLNLRTIHAQNVEWLRNYGSQGPDNSRSLSTDDNGNVFITGSLNGYIDLGNNKSVNGNGSYAAKFDKSGNCMWAVPLPGKSVELAATHNGEAIVLGLFTGYVNIGPQYFNTEKTGIYLTRIDDFGNIFWAKKIAEGWDLTLENHVDVDLQFNSYVSVSFEKPLIFSGEEFKSKGGIDFLIAKLDPNGNPIWKKTHGSEYHDWCNDLAVEKGNEEFIITGQFSKHTIIGGKRIEGADNTFFIGKFNPSGNLIFLNHPNTSGYKNQVPAVQSNGKAIAYGPNNTFYVLGEYTGIFDWDFYFGGRGISSVFVLKFTQDGQIEWAKPLIPSDADGVLRGDDLSFKNGHLWISGSSQNGYMNFAFISFENKGGTDGWIVKMDHKGDLLWAEEFSGPGEEKNGGIAADRFGNCYYSAFHSGGARFAGNNLISNGSEDVALARITPKSSTVDSLDKIEYCAGDSIFYEYKLDGNFDKQGKYLAVLSLSNGGFYSSYYYLNISNPKNSPLLKISGKIPKNISSGTRYRVIVYSTTDRVNTYPSQDLIIHALPISAGNDTALCIGRSMRLAPQSEEDFNFTWTPQQWMTDISETPLITPESDITYVLHAEDAYNCTNEDTIKIKVLPPLVMNFSTPDSACYQETIHFDGTGQGGDSTKYVFTWYDLESDSISGFGKEFYLLPERSSRYRISLWDNCSVLKDSADFSLFVRDSLSIDSGFFSKVCKGDDLNFTMKANGGKIQSRIIKWYSDIGKTLIHTGENYSFTADTTQDLYVVAFDGCSKGKSAMIRSEVRQPLNLQVLGDSLLCNGQSTFLFVDGHQSDSTRVSFTWAGLGSGTSKTVAPIQSTTYKISVQDSCGFNTGDIFKSVKVTEPLSVFAGNDTVKCHGMEIKLKAKASAGDSLNYKFQWVNVTDNILLPEGNNITVAPEKTTFYQVNVKDGCSNDDSSGLTVIVPLALRVSTISDTDNICVGDSVWLKSVGSGGHSFNHKFQWIDNSDNSVLGDSANILIHPNKNLSARIVLTDACSKPDSAIVNINVNALPVAMFKADSIEGCSPLKVTFTNQSWFAAGALLQWTFSDSTPVYMSGDYEAINHIFDSSGTYEVSLRVIQPGGCSDTIIQEIKVHEGVFASFEADREKANVLDPPIKFKNTSINGSSYSWNFGDSSSSSDHDPEHHYADTGHYSVELKASNGVCSSVTYKVIHISDDFNFYVPTAFTPNGDGLNDVFKPEYTGTLKYKLEIFNRWGQLIYTEESPEGKGWNGKDANGNILNGVFLYQFTIMDYDKMDQSISGSIEVLR